MVEVGGVGGRLTGDRVCVCVDVFRLRRLRGREKGSTVVEGLDWED